MSDPAADIDRVWTLLEDISVAMVVTHEGQGRNMRSRPMAARPAREEGAIYFLTDVDSPKAGEIRRDETICLALADQQKQKNTSRSPVTRRSSTTGTGSSKSGRSTTKRSGRTKATPG